MSCEVEKAHFVHPTVWRFQQGVSLVFVCVEGEVKNLIERSLLITLFSKLATFSHLHDDVNVFLLHLQQPVLARPRPVELTQTVVEDGGEFCHQERRVTPAQEEFLQLDLLAKN